MNKVALEKTEAWIKNTLEPMIAKGEAFDVTKEMVGIVFARRGSSTLWIQKIGLYFYPNWIGHS